jgi:hypothetical protein
MTTTTTSSPEKEVKKEEIKTENPHLMMFFRIAMAILLTIFIPFIYYSASLYVEGRAARPDHPWTDLS